MSTKKERMNVTIDGRVLEELKKMADGDVRSLSSMVNYILSAHVVESQKQKSR